MMMKLIQYFHFNITFHIIMLKMFCKNIKDCKSNSDKKRLKLSKVNICSTKLQKQLNKNKINIRKIKHLQIL